MKLLITLSHPALNFGWHWKTMAKFPLPRTETGLYIFIKTNLSEQTAPLYMFHQGWFEKIFFVFGNLCPLMESQSWLPRWRIVSVKTLNGRVDFLRKRIVESTAFLIVFILNLIFTSSIEIKSFERKIPDLKIFCSRWSITACLVEKIIFFALVWQKILKKVRIWQIKVKLSSQRVPVLAISDPASVELNENFQIDRKISDKVWMYNISTVIYGDLL